MIRLGLTSFSEHERLTGKKRSTLYEYAGHLPLVEMDTAYYGIPKQESVKRWVESVPANFKFVVKAYSGISCQGDWETYYKNEEEMIQSFLHSMQPIIDSGKLFAFLVQFSASFGCTKENVRYLEKIEKWFNGLPVAVELRNGSWYQADYIKSTLAFMKERKFSLVVVDEPQIPINPVPFFPFATNQAFILFRFHGRNAAGWLANDKEWRKKRTLYRYNSAEIASLSEAVRKMSLEVKETGVIFNNNSGGDAAGNALEMKKVLNLKYEELNPKQMDLF
ncbi:DUF72 domain-containing protein [Enterococcus sp. BWB1-3]|uniref:DUF72 domain-containing protein n=1 Tax=unclassified Enterococcus TaxID=2608891 RepID=UPI0019243580|nr:MULTISPECIES: DUF72 domain-containing protein [unclassified Enterococcus]MBL1228868.1 DUF72 domain-containing protein [Enterococcus sp. BWB1-3]MCB5951589.1 DUF72 domain-containing protein [Enterococcus sp. BWT-B8]